MSHNHWQTANRYFSPLRILYMIAGGVVIACIFAFAFGWLVMLLWNRLMPDIFGLKIITYWQAFGIVILSRLLFSGLSGHHHKSHHLSRWDNDRNLCGSSHDDWIPGGDPRNWQYYRDYWTMRGKNNFEQYLKEKSDSESDIKS
jgi:hypothetical protein